MLSKLTQFVKRYKADIILVVGVILISLLSFAMGYIVAKTYDKGPIKIEESGHYWSGNSGIVFGLEAFGKGP